MHKRKISGARLRAGRRVVGAQDLPALADADNDRDDGERQDDQHDRRGDIGEPFLEALAKARRCDLVGLVGVAFRLGREDEADQEGGSGPVETPEENAEDADRHQRHEIAERLAGLEGGERDHHEQEGGEQREADGGQARDLAGKKDAEPGADDIGERQRPDDGVGDVQIVPHHMRAGVVAEKRDAAQEHRHRSGARNAEDKRRHQAAALLGVVRAFRADHAADVAAAERLLSFADCTVKP